MDMCFKRGLRLAVCMGCALPAMAQTVPPPWWAEPLDPTRGGASKPYVSPFSTTRYAADAARTSWPAANEAVHQAGGWRAYAREAEQGNASSTEPSAPAGSPPAHRHPGSKP